MAISSKIWALSAAGLMTASFVLAGISAGTATAGGPGGYVDETADDISVAVGSGVFKDTLVGFTATGDTDDEASAAVIGMCQRAGGSECTSDEVTNDTLCIVSVGDPDNYVVAGGAGPTVEAARIDAFNRAAANGTPLPQKAVTVQSACP